jgi:hypothetical protein
MGLHGLTRCYSIRPYGFDNLGTNIRTKHNIHENLIMDLSSESDSIVTVDMLNQQDSDSRLS